MRAHLYVLVLDGAYAETEDEGLASADDHAVRVATGPSQHPAARGFVALSNYGISGTRAARKSC